MYPFLPLGCALGASTPVPDVPSLHVWILWIHFYRCNSIDRRQIRDGRTCCSCWYVRTYNNFHYIDAHDVGLLQLFTRCAAHLVVTIHDPLLTCRYLG